MLLPTTKALKHRSHINDNGFCRTVTINRANGVSIGDILDQWSGLEGQLHSLPVAIYVPTGEHEGRLSLDDYRVTVKIQQSYLNELDAAAVSLHIASQYKESGTSLPFPKDPKGMAHWYYWKTVQDDTDWWTAPPKSQRL